MGADEQKADAKKGFCESSWVIIQRPGHSLLPNADKNRERMEIGAKGWRYPACKRAG